MLKILFADDSMTAQNMGKKILADAGYDVIAVSNGAAAAKKLIEQTPDVAILDVHMPGYSGFEVCAKIRSVPATAKMPVLLTVGKMEPYSVEEGARVKADGVIIKPFEASVLLATVRNLAERAQATRAADPDEYEATMRIEPPRFEEFKDESYAAWKSESEESEAGAVTAERGRSAGAGTPTATPAHAFDQTMPIHPQPAANPAFADTLPPIPPRQAAVVPAMSPEPHFPIHASAPAFAVEETREYPSMSSATEVPVVPEAQPIAVANPAFEDTLAAWPGEQQAAVQAAARAAIKHQQAAAPVQLPSDYIDTEKIEPVRQPAVHPKVEEALLDTQKIVPVPVAAREPAAVLETFETFTPPVSAEPPVDFEPTILAKTADPAVAREPSLETPFNEVESPEIQTASEPGLLGNAAEAGFATGAFSRNSSVEPLQATQEWVSTPPPPASFSRPQDIAFEKMVSDLLDREPMSASFAEPNAISPSAIPIPEEPSSVLSKYVALGRAEETQIAGDVHTVEITQEFSAMASEAAAAPAVARVEVEPAHVGASAPVHETAHDEPPHADLKIDTGLPHLGVDIPPQVTEEIPELDPSAYAPTMEYSYPEAAHVYDGSVSESPVSPAVESVTEEIVPPLVADAELAAELAAALEHIEAAPKSLETEPVSAVHGAAHLAAEGSAMLDAETVSLIVTKVLDRFVPEIVRVIAHEVEAIKHSRPE